MNISTIPTRDLVEELKTRDGVAVYPRWGLPYDSFGHLVTIPGDSILLWVQVDEL